ncbi:MAG: PAS domain-containing protein, partial [Anaerolineaceae bacterium]|nr:PAS domain-containing protein [Anaerolineaceae bacterium]
RRGCNIERLVDRIQEMVSGDRIHELSESTRGEASRLQEALNNLLSRARQRVESQTLALREEQIRTRVLQADKRHMQAVLNSIADAVLVTNSYGDITLANGTAEQVLGFTFNGGDRKPLAEVFGEASLLAAVDQLQRSEHHVPRKVVEFESGSNGETRTYKATVNAVRSRAGEHEELSAIVTVLHDVTREREVARMKNDFISKVTHELRTPLSSIRAYVEMLVDGEAQDAETQNEFYQIIDSESDRLSRMIENILNISRIEAGLTKVQKGDIALTGMLKEVVNCLRPQAAEKEQVLEAELSAVFYQVHADYDMLYQAILNVVSNAIKYTPAGGTIHVASELKDGMVVVRVSDTGMGIPAEDLPRLFDKFYRVGANKKAAKGTGLGLALVKEIIETLHHGQVNVESEVGKGTTFILQLPVAE